MDPSTFAPRISSPATGVVVTGGASGIGLASAEALAAVGRPVAIWDLTDERALAAAEQLATAYGVTTFGLGVDVRDVDAIAAAADRTRAALPSVGGIVHCAGTVDTGSLEGVTAETWDSGINVHLRPIPFLVQAFLADLVANPGSAVVATSSINATLGNAANPIYTAGKGGVLSLVRSLADRLGRDGIRINSISPGQIRTPMMQPTFDARGEERYNNRILLGRVGEPPELGRVVRFLLSDEASYITASEIVVDGGNISSQR
jgi:NAD(P)-dependent dehydrogenase (short-subunit alcohol dehydrogenase family)